MRDVSAPAFREDLYARGAAEAMRGDGYRPDIDGLRGIAVLAVVVFHAMPHVAPGGFVGVDVFFVISGFLITRILLTERSVEGGVRQFYVRRLRRLAPALLVVLATTLAAGWLLLLPNEYRDLGKHAAGSAAFIANIVLWDQTGYFFAADRKLLLHLWSLGVEEQFYLLWPLAVTVAARRRLVPWLLAGTLAISFALNVWLTYAARPQAFFMFHTRAWELALGGALAYLALARPIAHRWLGASSVAGLALIGAAIVHLTGERAFPGWLALPPTLGALAVLAAGPSSWLNRVVLAWRPLVFLGLISYPLYLWHWPLLGFLRLVQPTVDVPTLALAVVASIALAWATTRWIECPIRFGDHRFGSVIALCGGLAMIMVVGMAIVRGHVISRAAGFGLDRFLAAASEDDTLAAEEGARTFRSAGLTFRAFDSHTDETVLYVGDSKARHYAPRIAYLIRTAPDEVRTAVFAICPGAPPIAHVRSRIPDGCATLVDAALAYAQRADVRAVVIAAAWHNHFDGAHDFRDAGGSRAIKGNGEGARLAFAALEATLLELRRAGKTTYLVLDSPSGPAMHPGNFVRRSPAGFSVEGPGIRQAELLGTFGWINRALRGVAARTGTVLIDPMEHLCADDVCPALTPDRLPIYLDTGHLRPSYVRAQATFIDSTIRRPR